MKRTLINETPNLIGQDVELSGWVHNRRDHGKLIFIDLRDRTGIVQTVIIPDKTNAYRVAKDARHEYVITIKGLVKKRPGIQKKEGSLTGQVEIEVSDMEIISAVKKELPFDKSKQELNLHMPTLFDNRHLASP